MSYEIIKINEDTWRVEDNGVRFFLLTGNEKALLIDSGMQVHNAKDIAKTLTDLPIELLNTHADVDHIGSNDQFEWVYMNPAELTNYHKSHGKKGNIVPVWDGDCIDLGGRELYIITIPGHTPGSIALIDKKYRVLYSGDSIQDGRIFMFGIQREIDAYYISLNRLLDYKEEFDVIYPSHGTPELDKNFLDLLIDATKKTKNNEFETEPGDFFGNKMNICNAGVATFLLD